MTVSQVERNVSDIEEKRRLRAAIPMIENGNAEASGLVGKIAGDAGAGEDLSLTRLTGYNPRKINRTGLTNMPGSVLNDLWPELPYEAWKDTRDTLHLWTQIAGKIRLALTPWLNHSWHVPLYVTARGLNTSPIPYAEGAFEIEFDFNAHLLRIMTGDGRERRIPLQPRSVAEFYELVMWDLNHLQIAVNITELPSEIPGAILFSQDHTHSAYDPVYANRFWRALVQVDRVFKHFRTGSIGKASPVHFFWGSFDLAVTRFSGRRAPPHPGGAPGLSDAVMREAYSHEVSSAGFWPGGSGIDYAAFYSYAYPTPEGFGACAVKPEAAFFHEGLGEFLLPYEAVRTAPDPDAALLSFLESTYEAAANLAHWDRPALECAFGAPGVPRATNAA